MYKFDKFLNDMQFDKDVCHPREMFQADTSQKFSEVTPCERLIQITLICLF
jgi:hypothetical protein